LSLTSARRPPRSGAVDAVDRRLLAALRANGRATFAELGRRVGMSAPSAHERVRRLEDAAVITGYSAAVDPLALGLAVSALVGIFQGDDAEHDEVAERLRGVAEVEDCWVVAGDEAFVVKVRVADVDALERTLGTLRRIPGVARTRTTVVLSTRWEDRIALDAPAGPQPPPNAP
jgi:Lrp/AsnC family leucine-responsive transcriptional regulator